MHTETEDYLYDNCPVCSGSISTWRSLQADGKSYNMDLCSDCGFAFVNPRPTLGFLMDFYSTVGHGGSHGSGKVPDLNSVIAGEKKDPVSTIDAKRIIKTISTLAAGSGNRKFLDVGCGYGIFSKQALDAGFDVSALDLADNEREIYRGMTGLTPVNSSFEDFECDPGSLSVILMSQILEHALDVNLWIEKAHGLLQDDGIIAIALPNYGSLFRLILQEKEPYICPPEHLNFFNPKSLSTLLEKHGFEVEKVQWISRLPKSTFDKRMPSVGKPLLPLVYMMSSLSLKTIDALHLGSIINIYARKTGSGS